MCVLLIQMAMSGVMVIMPLYLEIVKKIPIDNAGTILLALPVGMIVTAPSPGKFRRDRDKENPSLPVLCSCAVALFFLSTILPTRA